MKKDNITYKEILKGKQIHFEVYINERFIGSLKVLKDELEAFHILSSMFSRRSGIICTESTIANNMAICEDCLADFSKGQKHSEECERIPFY